jgi:hypothetical protein
MNCDRKGSVEKICGREPRGAWRQNELIGGKPPVKSNFDFDLWPKTLTLKKATGTFAKT